MPETLNVFAAWLSEAWPAMVSIAWAVLALGILVFAHEFGHFIVAKLGGVGVLKFSLGFGKKVVGFTRGETEYMISVFPLGGYVKMVGEDEEAEDMTEQDKARSFLSQPVAKRAAIVFAGPLFNVLLAVLLCYGVFIAGYPTAIAKVRAVVPGSPAAAAGFMAGDVIDKVDGNGVDVWEQVAVYIRENPGRRITFNVIRDGNPLELVSTPVEADGRVGMGLMGPVIVAAIKSPSPADTAGIKAKDRVVGIDGRSVGSWGDMARVVAESPGKPLLFTVERDGGLVDLKVTPKLEEVEDESGEKVKRGIIGIHMGAETVKVSYGPVESIGLSLDQTGRFADLIVTFLSRIVKGKEDASQIGGPVAIVQISGRQARQGLTDFVIFLALLSVNLGVINLLPIPILDGGHLFFFGLEAVMGRPLSMKKREVAQQVGLFLLITLMVFVFYNDIMRLMGLAEMWK